MVKKALLILIAVLLAVIVWLILSRPDTEKPAIIKHETGIKQNQVKIDSVDKAQKAMIQELVKDTLKSSLALKRSKREIQGLKKELQQLRPEVQVYLDSIPVLNEFVGLQDSVISAQGTLIDSLQTWQSIERMKFKRLLLASEEKFNESVSINSHFKAIDDIRKKDNRRLRKINRLLLVAVPVGFVGGVLLAK